MRLRHRQSKTTNQPTLPADSLPRKSITWAVNALLGKKENSSMLTLSKKFLQWQMYFYISFHINSVVQIEKTNKLCMSYRKYILRLTLFLSPVTNKVHHH